MRTRRILPLSLTAVFLAACASETQQDTPASDTSAVQTEGGLPMVVISTSLGDISAELYPDEAPVTVANFLEYVDAEFFDGTIFHRVIPGFMVQGGGFTPNMTQKQTGAPIVNEANNGLMNERGTLAMARLPDPNTATAQFFINLVDNDFLNHGARGFGYAVFGRVVQGMEVVDRIAAVPRSTVGGFQDVPVEPVVIRSVRLTSSGVTDGE